MSKIILEYAVIGLISVAASGVYVYAVDRPPRSDTKPKAIAQSSEAAKPVTPKYQSLPSVVGNLRFPSDAWIRLDVAVAVAPENSELFMKLREQIGEDILVFLRTLSIPELEGPFGVSYLKADLTDRLRIRSENKLSELVITTMVLQ